MLNTKTHVQQLLQIFEKSKVLYVDTYSLQIRYLFSKLPARHRTRAHISQFDMYPVHGLRFDLEKINLTERFDLIGFSLILCDCGIGH